MCLLSERDNRQLRANLWRSRTVISRNKLSVCKALIMPFLFLCIWFLFIAIADMGTKDLDYPAIENFAVTADSPNVTDMVFQEPKYTTNLLMLNCTLFGGNRIGLVKKDEAEPDAIAANNALDEIFRQMNEAYVLNNHYAEVPYNISGFLKLDFKNNNHLETYVKNKDYIDKQLCFALGWKKFDLANHDYQIELRWQPIVNVPASSMNQQQYETARYNQLYLQQFNETGFLEVMSVATKVLLTQQYGIEENEKLWNFFFTPMSTGVFQDNTGSASLLIMWVAIMVVVYAQIGNDIVNVASEDHEDKIKWMLKLIGMQNSVPVCQQLILFSFSSFFFVTFVIVICWCTAIGNVNLLLLILFMNLVSVEIMLISLITKYTMSKRVGKIFTFSYYLGMFIFSTLQAFQQIIRPKSTYWSCVFPWLQAQNFVKMIFVGQNKDMYFSFDNLSMDVVNGITLAKIIWISLIVTAVKILFFIYIWPIKIARDPDNPASWYYLVSPEWWTGKMEPERDDNAEPDFEFDEQTQVNLLLDGNEPNSPATPMTVTRSLLQNEELDLVRQGVMQDLTGGESTERLIINKLVKKYGAKKAVNNLTLTMFQNEILVLLGHNGAGKTTTISMLTGLERPTSGTATAFGIDLFKEQQTVKDFIGVCPQHDVLFEKMTVRENLSFFCQFKNIDREEIVIEETLERFNLVTKCNTLAGDLSGGQKRKLQLAIALLGNSKLVLLDEPSSGMDPTARRETWEIIKQAKENKIIILTTHYMDEAEILADRVAIISKGSLQTCGTPLFLKNKYGSGFFVEVTPNDPKDECNLELLGLIDKYVNNQQIKEDAKDVGLIRGTEYIPQANVMKNDSDQIVYQMPYSIGPYFKQFFAEIDADKGRYGIKEYSVRCSTLEEVFIEIGRKENASAEEEMQKANKKLKVTHMPNKETPDCFRRYLAMAKFNFQASFCGGTTLVLLIVDILTFITMCIFAVVPSAGMNKPVDYHQVAQVYSEKIPIDFLYNKNWHTDPNDPLSTESFFDNVFNSYNSSVINPVPQDWQYDSQSESLDNFLDRLAFDVSSQEDKLGAVYVFINDTSPLQCIVFGNMSSQAAFPTYASLMLQAMARYMANQPQISLSFVNHPLPLNIATASIGIAAIPQTFATYPVIAILVTQALMVGTLASRFTSGFYDAVMQKGGTRCTYFLGHYTLDVFHNLMLVLSMQIIIMMFQIACEQFWIIGIIWSFTDPLFVYCLLYPIVQARQWSKAIVYTVIIVIAFSGNVIASTLTQIRLMSNDDDGANIMRLFGAIPVFNFLFAAQAILTKFEANLYSEPSTLADGTPPLGKWGAQIPLRYMIGCLILYSFLTLLSIFGCCNRKANWEDAKPDGVKNEDKFVKKERERIKGQISTRIVDSPDMLQVYQLVKQYKRKNPNEVPQVDMNQSYRSDRPHSTHSAFSFGAVEQDNNVGVQSKNNKGTKAVKGTSFGVASGECFSLLGVNGAGKTSTFNCLTGNEDVSGGYVFLDGKNVNTLYKKPQQLHNIIGYCPQYNCIDDKLTVFQTINLFASLVGIDKVLKDHYVNYIINKFGLSMFVTTKAGALSGGNKRKLCLAMAMIGRPKIVFIDEASAGVDPGSRRVMWKAIRDEGQESAVVITTHAMEEAEALSTKLGIMVAGKFKCFGSLQHIKQEYGLGYEIEFNLDQDGLTINIPPIDDEARYSNSEPDIRTEIKDWQARVQEMGIHISFDFSEEFSAHGIFCNYWYQVQQQEIVDLQVMQKDVLLQNIIGAIIEELSNKASNASIQQLDGHYVHCRLEKNNKTYGYMFGLLEEMKLKFPIKEYSCQQSTLEQVFNAFATEDNFAALNEKLSRRSSSVQA